MFEECTSLKKVNFEDGAQITELQGFFFTDLQCDNCRGHGVFTGCTSLETIILPKSITIIGDGSFRGCTNLKSVEFEIGSNLSSICGDRCGHTSGSSGSSGVFQGCSYLSTIKLGTSTPPYCNQYTFYGIPQGSIKLKVPAGSLSTYKASNYWKSFKIEEYYE